MGRVLVADTLEGTSDDFRERANQEQIVIDSKVTTVNSGSTVVDE